MHGNALKFYQRKLIFNSGRIVSPACHTGLLASFKNNSADVRHVLSIKVLEI